MPNISSLRNWLISNRFQATKEVWRDSVYCGFIMENDRIRLFFRPDYQLKRAVLMEIA